MGRQECNKKGEPHSASVLSCTTLSCTRLESFVPDWVHEWQGQYRLAAFFFLQVEINFASLDLLDVSNNGLFEATTTRTLC